MKKLIFGLLATVLFGLIGYSQTNNFTPSSKYGELHNEFLKITREKFIINENSTIQEMFYFIVNEYNMKYSNELSDAELNFYIERINYAFGVNRKIKSLTSEGMNEAYNKGVQKYGTQKLYAFQNDLLKRNESFEITLNKLNSLNKNNDLTVTEIDDINKMVSVLKASNEFWLVVYPNTQVVANRCSPIAQRCLADLGGGWLGGWVGGTLCSSIVEYGQSTNGGGCW